MSTESKMPATDTPESTLDRSARDDSRFGAWLITLAIAFSPPAAAAAEAAKIVVHKPLQSLDVALSSARQWNGPILIALSPTAESMAAEIEGIVPKVAVTSTTFAEVVFRFPAVAPFDPQKPGTSLPPEYLVLAPNGDLIQGVAKGTTPARLIEILREAGLFTANPALAMEKQKKRIAAKLLIVGTDAPAADEAARELVRLEATVYRGLLIEAVSKAPAEKKLAILAEQELVGGFAEPLLAVLLRDDDPFVRQAAIEVVRNLPIVCYASRTLLANEHG